jgi:hypothetical protein
MSAAAGARPMASGRPQSPVGTVSRLAALARRRLAAAPHEADGTADAGNAIVEFLGVALVLLVPVVYLVLILGRIQAASFAVDGAAREAARAVVTAPDAETATQRAAAAVALALGDQGFEGDPADVLRVTCSDVCLDPGTTVTVDVALDVVLPGVPGWLQGAVPLSIPVTATATSAVDTYVGRG